MDINDLIFGGELIFLLIFGIFIGKFLDTSFRAKLFRVFTRKDWGVLDIISVDNKTIQSVAVNFTGDIISVKGRIWVILKDRIYRQDKPERGFRLDKEDIPVKWIEGVPHLFVKESSFMPVDFEGNDGATKPEEISSVFLAWINNQMAKGLAGLKNYQNFLIIAIILSLCAALLSYMAWQNTNDIKGTQAADDAKLNTIISQTGSAIHVGSTGVVTPTPNGGGG